MPAFKFLQVIEMLNKLAYSRKGQRASKIVVVKIQPKQIAVVFYVN